LPSEFVRLHDKHGRQVLLICLHSSGRRRVNSAFIHCIPKQVSRFVRRMSTRQNVLQWPARNWLNWRIRCD